MLCEYMHPYIMDSGNLVCFLAFALQKAIVLFLKLPIFLGFNGEESGVSLHSFCCVVQDSWAGALSVVVRLAEGSLLIGACTA